MSLPQKNTPRKDCVVTSIDVRYRLRSSEREGCYIKYALALKRHTLTKIGVNLNISLVTVRNVVFGSRRSARVENEIARILGKRSWNDVVTEARLATGTISAPPHPSPRIKGRKAS